VDERTSIEVPETKAQSPMGLAVLPERQRLAISPLNRRRWESFKANPMGGPAFASMVESSQHRDELARTNATYK